MVWGIGTLKEVCYLVDGLGIWESVEAVGEGGGFAIGSEGIGYKTPSSNLIGDREGKANFSLLKGRFGQPKECLTRVLLSSR